MDLVPNPIEGQQLTSWTVLAGGTRVRMNFIDAGGGPHQIVLPFDVLSSLLMTLPSMVQAALNARFADGSLRFVQSLGSWHLEQAEASANLILRLRTKDGFEVAFALNATDASSLAAALIATPDIQTSRRPN